MASAASIDATRPLVSTIPNASCVIFLLPALLPSHRSHRGDQVSCPQILFLRIRDASLPTGPST
ncbi:hypothetical protein GCWU000342_00644 [Shuttleworthella satelles DSM 14600]|uniref:Uncharacterized protein n=1 Tax=Shuttleworthella satelles DSM 14600 TaxID=626523 RepID=C4G9J2_9FIRM|nr:hypothetical protein GCWU000342_00644 [Shuttleworthia satelles DSM 14600]